MAAIIDRGADVLSALLGLDHGLVPDLLVSEEWARPETPWQALDRPVLEHLIVGGPLCRDSGKGDRWPSRSISTGWLTQSGS
jgi:hypothetical protein